MKSKILYFSALLVLFFGCKEDDEQTLTLSIIQTDNLVSLEWNKPALSKFDYYMVMRASDGQHYSQIAHITDVDETKYSDYTYPIVDSLYYKVIAVGNETVSSGNTLCVINDGPILFDANYLRGVEYLDEVNKLCVFDESQLKLFDIETQKFEKTMDLPYIYEYSYNSFWQKNKGKTEFYGYTDNHSISVFDAENLILKETISHPHYLYYNMPTTANSNGMIYTSNYYLYMIDRNNNNAVTSYPTEYSYRNIVYNATANKLYCYYYGYFITICTLDEQGKITGHNSRNTDFYNDPLYVDKSPYFIWRLIGGETVLYNCEDDSYKTLDHLPPYPYPICACVKGNILYLGVDDVNNIFCYSLPDCELIEAIQLRTVPLKLFPTEDGVYYYGRYNNYQCLFGKIKSL